MQDRSSKQQLESHMETTLYNLNRQGLFICSSFIYIYVYSFPFCVMYVCCWFSIFNKQDSPFLIECFDFNTSGNHVLIGYVIHYLFMFLSSFTKDIINNIYMNRKLQQTMGDLENLHITRASANLMSLPSHFRGVEKVLSLILLLYHKEKENRQIYIYIYS